MKRSGHIAIAVGYLTSLGLVSAYVVNPADFNSERILDGTALSVVLGGVILFGFIGFIAYLVSRTPISFYISATLVAVLGTRGMMQSENSKLDITEKQLEPKMIVRSNLNKQTDELRRALESIGLDKVMEATISESHKNLPISVSEIDTITAISYLPSTNLQIYRHTVHRNWEERLSDIAQNDLRFDQSMYFQNLATMGINAACSNGVQRTLLEKGLRISHVYSASNGTELAQFEIENSKCERISP